MPPDVRVCFFGDSLTAGVGDDAALGWVGRVVAAARRAGADLTGYNLGVRGETGPEVEARWRREAEPRFRGGAVHGVVVSFGVNDTTVDEGQRRVAEFDTVAALGRIAERAEADGWPLLVVGPTLVDDPEQNRRIVELSAAMRGWSADSGVPYVEVAAGLDDAEWLTDVASGDGAHPSERGYDRLSSLIDPMFAAWLHELAERSGAASARR
ncbi:GDSL-type esterase/lipase family protein [Blastococcus deserti]|uniref:GDSL-type esterase/lipase family protein n=1 Tax=Blastococcus deserti TaxID=2259033 RepID=A0ABW4XBK5_9ACTN